MKCSTKFGLLTAAALTSILAVQPTASADFRVLGGIGYKSLTADQDENDESIGGYSLKLGAQYDIVEVAPGVGIYAGAGFGFDSLSDEEETNGIKEKFTFSPIYLGLEGGVNFGAIPMLNIQGFLGYDFGVGGEWEIETSGSLEGFSVSEKVSLDIDKYGTFNLGARALYTFAPMFSGGAQLAWHTGSFKVKDDSGNKSDSVDISGFSVGLVVGASF